MRRRVGRSGERATSRHCHEDDGVSTREHDIVLHGATGFVGALVAAHLAENAPPDVRIGLSGRSREKLERARAALPPSAHSWPLITADAGDPTALAALAASSRVVVSTVGPICAMACRWWRRVRGRARTTRI